MSDMIHASPGGRRAHRFAHDAARPGRTVGVMALTLALLAGCASSTHRAPVETRQPPRAAAPSVPAPSPAPAPAAPAAAPTPAPEVARPLPGAENAGKPGYYTVRRGDTLIRIGLEHGQPWRDIARWNGLEPPHNIEIGQVLRVVPPEPQVAVRPVAPAGRVDGRPLEPRPGATPGAAASAPPAAPGATGLSEDEFNWIWPANGPLLAGFDEAKTKGLTIGGKAGDPVLAAADGRVVYAGSGLRGYGNLVILKHSTNFLSAYAHNQALLVKEDEVVRRGQRIAEMGSTDAEGVQLHFEIRRQGKPIDPAKLLPPR